MRAAQIVAHREPLVVGEAPDPKCEAAGVVVRVEANGMCRSDWHTWNGDWAWFGGLPPLPVVPGHEFSGTVLEVGPEVRAVRVGDRVTVPFTEACGRCESCARAGRPSAGPSCSRATATAAGTANLSPSATPT